MKRRLAIIALAAFAVSLAMGAMRILRGMILARRRKGKEDFGRQTSDFGN